MPVEIGANSFFSGRGAFRQSTRVGARTIGPDARERKQPPEVKQDGSPILSGTGSLDLQKRAIVVPDLLDLNSRQHEHSKAITTQDV